MAITTLLKENWKEDKHNLFTTIETLKKSLADYKVERKTEWRTFKNKFKDDMKEVDKSLKRLTHLYKKQI